MKGATGFNAVAHFWLTGRSWAKQIDCSRFSFPQPNPGFRNDAAPGSTSHYFMMVFLCFVRNFGSRLKPA